MGFWSSLRSLPQNVTSAFKAAGNVGNGIANAFSGVGKDVLGDDVSEVIDNISGHTANEQWQEQMDYQRNYYQNMVDSMLKAGLNPGLISGGGAGSMPSGASPAASGQNLGVIGAMIDSLAGARLTGARVLNTQADTEKKVTETYGQKIDNMIKEKVGLDQAYANLGLSNLSVEEKRASIPLLVQKYALQEAERLKTLSETDKIKYQAESQKIANELESAKLDELKALGDFNGRMVTLSESQAGSLGASLNFFGLGGGSVSPSLSQMTSTQIPLIWYVKATNKNLSDSERKEYCNRILWLLREDIGSKASDLKKASK